MRTLIRDLSVTLAVFALSAVLVMAVTSGLGNRAAAPEAAFSGTGATGIGGAGIAEALNDAMAGVVDRCLPSVVSLHTDRAEIVAETRNGELGPVTTKRRIRQPGVGSGVIVSREGLVLTAWHVVEGEDVLIRATMHGDEEPRRATLVDRDESADIALLRIEPKGEGETFSFMPFGDSDLMRPGHLVLALGAPLNLSETVTQGIISNRSRRVSDTLESYLQTDCTINPGNSGGPLVNLKGELIGINIRLVIGSRDAPSGQSYGLALPSNEAQDAYERMIHKDRPRGYLGVTVDNWPVASYQTGSRPECAVVVGVEKGSPAAAAGLRKDDLVLAMDGEPVRSSMEFFRRLRKQAVGEQLPLRIRRDGAELTLTAGVVDLKTIFDAEEMPESREVAGITVRGLRRVERGRLALRDEGGVLVENVAEGSPLSGKVSTGDVILRVMAQRVPHAGGFSEAMDALRPNGGYLEILRANGSVERAAVPAKPG